MYGHRDNKVDMGNTSAFHNYVTESTMVMQQDLYFGSYDVRIEVVSGFLDRKVPQLICMY